MAGMSMPPVQYDPSLNPAFAPRVVVTDVDMTIGAMCRFMVKWAIAAIPAVLILTVIWVIVAALLVGMFGGIGGALHHSL